MSTSLVFPNARFSYTPWDFQETLSVWNIKHGALGRGRSTEILASSTENFVQGGQTAPTAVHVENDSTRNSSVPRTHRGGSALALPSFIPEMPAPWLSSGLFWLPQSECWAFPTQNAALSVQRTASRFKLITNLRACEVDSVIY